MNTSSEQAANQVERFIRKIAEKFPQLDEPTLLTDIHIRANQDTGELVAFDDDDNEITRVIIGPWIGNTDDDFYASITSTIRTCLENQNALIENMGILNPFSFVLEDDEQYNIAELYVVDGDTVIINTELMSDLENDLDLFLAKLLEK